MALTTDREVPIGRSALIAAPLLSIVAASILTGGTGAVLVNAMAGAAVVGACALVGLPVIRWLDLKGSTVLERVTMAAAAGAGLVGLLLFTLGGVGALSPITALTTVGTASVLAGLAVRPWRYGRELRAELERLCEHPVGLVLLGSAALVIGGALAASVVPPWDWDSLMYHLPIPARFLAEGTTFYDPVNVHAGYVGTVHMLYVLTTALGVPQAATVISGLFGLLLGVFVYSVTLRRTGATPAGAAIAGIAGSTLLVLVVITPRVDVTVTLFLFLAHFAVLKAATDETPRYLLAAAVFGGIAVSTKVYAGAYLLPLVVWVGWLLARRQVDRKHVTLAVLIGLFFTLPWLARNWVLFDNPLYPLFTGPGIPPWLRGEANVDGVTVSGVLSYAREPVSLGRLLFEPGLLSPEAEARYYFWSPLLAVGLLLIPLVPGAWRWALPAVAYLALVLGRSTRINLRYLIPIVPALSVATAMAAYHLTRGRSWLRRWGMTALLIVSLAPLALPIGLVWQWIREPVDSGRYDTIYAAAAAASQVVPEDGTILMLYEARGWPFDRPVIQDNRAITWPLLYSSGHADECLRRISVTHVLINFDALDFYSSRAGRLEHVHDGSLQQFIQRCLVEEARRGDHTLFRVRPEASGSAPSGPPR